MPRKIRKKKKENPIRENFDQGLQLLRQNPIFTGMIYWGSIQLSTSQFASKRAWAVVDNYGCIQANGHKLAQPEEWCHVLAHCLLHLGLGHVKKMDHMSEWNTACDCVVANFLQSFKIGKRPNDMAAFENLPSNQESVLYRIFCEDGIPPQLCHFGTAGPDSDDIIFVRNYHEPPSLSTWERRFADGLVEALNATMEDVSLQSRSEKRPLSPGVRLGVNWIMGHFPLIGSLAGEFEFIEDADLCRRMDISVAAVDATMKEIYINPHAGLNQIELRFVLAHELLHAGLRHDVRQVGRDSFLWNVACDYVINDWLVEMEVGQLPQQGGLYDPQFKGKSAEEVYDIICRDLRCFGKSATFRGVASGDILKPNAAWWSSEKGIRLDEFYRSCLANGLEYHRCFGRGTLSAGLVEEIRALCQPPIPWDVELAKWFDTHFAPVEKRRSFARPSRRQSSTPDIPRPRYVAEDALTDGRTFGVVLDTSMSMDRPILAKALGAIASYATSHDVPFVRVIYCDAIPYDAGYLPVEDIGERLRVRGRGGTILQPAIALLEKTDDFPDDGPILVITDGFCDHLRIRRSHAYLLPKGGSLPYTARGPVFRIV